MTTDTERLDEALSGARLNGFCGITKDDCGRIYEAARAHVAATKKQLKTATNYIYEPLPVVDLGEEQRLVANGEDDCSRGWYDCLTHLRQKYPGGLRWK